jgi:hypothetical protein
VAVTFAYPTLRKKREGWGTHSVAEGLEVGVGLLALALLVLRVLTDDAYYSATMDYFALVADLFY